MRLAVSIITWNNLDDITILMQSLRPELERYAGIHEFGIFITDNGSWDGTAGYLVEQSAELIDNGIFVQLNRLKRNVGIGIAKNMNIRQVVEGGYEYMFMFDSDVALIPGSLQYMLDYMVTHEEVACFGQHIDYFTRDKASIAGIPSVEEQGGRIEYGVLSGCGATRAWTHYALYRGSLFKQGIVFDETGPFGMPGYGFDDDDLGNQIYKSGYKIACFRDVVCYHNVNCSIPNLKKTGGLNMDEREKYFKIKWSIK